MRASRCGQLARSLSNWSQIVFLLQGVYFPSSLPYQTEPAQPSTQHMPEKPASLRKLLHSFWRCRGSCPKLSLLPAIVLRRGWPPVCSSSSWCLSACRELRQFARQQYTTFNNQAFTFVMGSPCPPLASPRLFPVLFRTRVKEGQSNCSPRTLRLLPLSRDSRERGEMPYLVPLLQQWEGED
jgi:hypothetical protein